MWGGWGRWRSLSVWARRSGRCLWCGLIRRVRLVRPGRWVRLGRVPLGRHGRRGRRGRRQWGGVVRPGRCAEVRRARGPRLRICRLGACRLWGLRLGICRLRISRLRISRLGICRLRGLGFGRVGCLLGCRVRGCAHLVRAGCLVRVCGLVQGWGRFLPRLWVRGRVRRVWVPRWASWVRSFRRGCCRCRWLVLRCRSSGQGLRRGRWSRRWRWRRWPRWPRWRCR